jgi:hypothetical protein
VTDLVAADTEKATIIRILNSPYTVFEALAYISGSALGAGGTTRTIKTRGSIMTALKQRAQALENQFARQAEIQFKARVRGSKMVGRWAAYTMGLDDVEAYAGTMAVQQVVEPHRLLEQLRQDFSKAGVTVTDADIDNRIHHFIEQATEEIYAGR